MRFEEELKVCIDLVYSLRDDILKIYNSADQGVEIKSDNSPVTLADKLVDRRIRDVLGHMYPNFSFLTEESADDFKRLNNDLVFIVDPIDGTKDFVLRNGEFTVNIGISYKHKPVLGVIYVPVSGELFYAAKGLGAFYRKDKESEPVKIHCSDKLEKLNALVSRTHFNDKEKEVYEKYSSKFESVKSVGSSLKGCLIAKGDADYHYRNSSNTKEWDTCAMQAIIEEAGGYLLKFDGTPIAYNREDVYNHDGYVICNRIENFLL